MTWTRVWCLIPNPSSRIYLIILEALIPAERACDISSIFRPAAYEFVRFQSIVTDEGSDKNWTNISLTLRNSFISLEKTDSVNVEAVEMNQTEAFQQEIELVSVLWLFFPVLFLHKFNYALIYSFIRLFIVFLCFGLFYVFLLTLLSLLLLLLSITMINTLQHLVVILLQLPLSLMLLLRLFWNVNLCHF